MNFLFTNPGVLWGLVAIAIPVAIHLLLRRKPVVEHWGATRFLKKVIERKRAQLQVHSYAHLFVRMAILGLLIIAAADPRIDASGKSVSSKRDVHRLLIIDLTMSMGATQDGDSRLDEVRRQISSLVSQSSPGDSWQLLLHGTDDEPIRFRVPTYESKLITDEILKLSPTSQSASLLNTFQRATSLIEEFPGTQNEVLFWTDLAIHDWKFHGSAEYELNARLEQLSQVAKVSVIDVAKKSQPNVAVLDLKLLNDRVSIGDKALIEASLKNYSTNPQTLIARLLMNEEEITEQSISLKPFETKQLIFEVVMTRAGIAECEIQIGQDFLNADNSRRLAFQVSKSIHVLIIEEESSSEALKQSDFLQLALSLESQTESVDFIPRIPKYKVTTVTPRLFQSSSLEKFNVVIVCGLSKVTEIDSQRLSNFVQQGGGILFTMSDDISLIEYNQQFGPARSGLIPVQLLKKVTIPNRESAPFQIGRIATDLPLLEPFERHPSAGLKTTRIYSYIESESGSNQGYQNVVSLENESPLILSQQQGLGKVYVITTALNTDWGSWVLWPSFLPMMQRLIDDLADRNSLIIDSVIGQEIPDEVVDRQLFSTIQDSHGETLIEGNLPGDDLKGIFDVLLDDPGIYTFRNEEQDQTVQILVRHVDTTESDLRHLEHRKLLSSSLFKGLNITVFEDVSEIAFTRLGIQSSEDSNLARWLLLAAMLLFFVDQIYAVRPVAALGALVGILLSGAITLYVDQTPTERILFILIFTFSCAYLSHRFSQKRSIKTHIVR